MLTQAGTNLFNDAADAGGSDGPGRTGPLRVTAAGWDTAPAVRCAAPGCFTVAFAGVIDLVIVALHT